MFVKVYKYIMFLLHISQFFNIGKKANFIILLYLNSTCECVSGGGVDVGEGISHNLVHSMVKAYNNVVNVV